MFGRNVSARGRLELNHRRRPVEYGAIGIHLQHLPEEARRIVLDERHPFGRILQTEAIAHLSWPQAFFSVHSDTHMSHCWARGIPLCSTVAGMSSWTAAGDCWRTWSRFLPRARVAVSEP